MGEKKIEGYPGLKCEISPIRNYPYNGMHQYATISGNDTIPMDISKGHDEFWYTKNGEEKYYTQKHLWIVMLPYESVFNPYIEQSGFEVRMFKTVEKACLYALKSFEAGLDLYYKEFKQCKLQKS